MKSKVESIALLWASVCRQEGVSSGREESRRL